MKFRDRLQFYHTDDLYIEVESYVVPGLRRAAAWMGSDTRRYFNRHYDDDVFVCRAVRR
jgi:hypothetical protein